MKKLILSLIFLCVFTSFAEITVNRKIHQGTIVKLNLKENVQWSDRSGTTIAKLPEPGNIFAIVTIKLAKGSSIGRYDFQLIQKGNKESFNALRITQHDGTFTSKTWAFKSKTENDLLWKKSEDLEGLESIEDGSLIDILFEIPSLDNMKFSMNLKLGKKDFIKRLSSQKILDFKGKSDKIVAKNKKKKK